MNSTIGICSLMCAFVMVFCTILIYPKALGDRNTFLAGFVNHEFLSFLGFVSTITIATAINVHFELNKYEEKINIRAFSATKRSLRISCISLILLLLLAIIVVVTKPLLGDYERLKSCANGAAILITLVSISILTDIVLAAFTYEPRIDGK